ncbi:MAG: nucleotidyltransferase domain-containing protein [Proteobacteria bacterium]|nr:nucleotidyltransferase domain-containing protein [Pseudomonadota bacterium]
MTRDALPPLPEALRAQQAAVAQLCQRLGVRNLEVFGSAAQGQFQPGRSDYDFLVEWDEQVPGSRAQRLIDLAESLEQLLGSKVDLLNPKYIRNPWLAHEVNRTRRPFHHGA